MNLTLTFFDLDFIIVRKGQKVKGQKRSKLWDYMLKSPFFFRFLRFSLIYKFFMILIFGEGQTVLYNYRHINFMIYLINIDFIFAV